MGEERVYLNGRILPAGEAHISIADVGFLHGGSVFTTLAAFNGRPFRLDRHLSRLFDTVEVLDIAVATDADTLTAAVADLLAANQLDRARLRITLSPGDVSTGRPTSLVTASPLPEYPPEWFTDGITAVVSSFRQHHGDPTYGYKTGCYFPRILARRQAHQKGAEEALWFTPEGRLAEGCFTNVFLVRDGRLVTPAEDTPVLPGVTRAAVIELARRDGLPHDAHAQLTMDDVLAAEEIFITASTMGPVPVTRVEERTVGDGKVGPVTGRLTHAYRQLVAAETADAAE